jgi:hypothetical protein
VAVAEFARISVAGGVIAGILASFATNGEPPLPIANQVASAVVCAARQFYNSGDDMDLGV